MGLHPLQFVYWIKFEKESEIRWDISDIERTLLERSGTFSLNFMRSLN